MLQFTPDKLPSIPFIERDRFAQFSMAVSKVNKWSSQNRHTQKTATTLKYIGNNTSSCTPFTKQTHKHLMICAERYGLLHGIAVIIAIIIVVCDATANKMWIIDCVFDIWWRHKTRSLDISRYFIFFFGIEKWRSSQWKMIHEKPQLQCVTVSLFGSN